MQSQKYTYSYSKDVIFNSHLSLRNSYELLYVGLQLYYSIFPAVSQWFFAIEFAVKVGGGSINRPF